MLEIPSKWAEVPPQVVIKLVGFVLSEMTPGLQAAALKVVVKRGRRYLRKLDDWQLAEVAGTVSWMWEEKISFPLIPWFQLRTGLPWRTYLLPNAKLENATCREWLLADEYFLAFADSGEAHDLDLLVATLCRRKNRDKQEARRIDDWRVKLSSRSEVEEWAKELSNADQRVKLFVLLFFSGCKEWVYRTYKPWLFEQEDDEVDEVKPKTFLDKLGWYGMFQRVAESGAFGSMHQVLDSKFKDVCLYLVTKKSEYDEAKRLERQANTKGITS